MKTARVIYNGALHAAEPAGDGAIRLDTGRVVAEEGVEWLPPVAPRTTFALVSSCPVRHSVGRSAEWAGRKRVAAMVESTARA